MPLEPVPFYFTGAAEMTHVIRLTESIILIFLTFHKILLDKQTLLLYYPPLRLLGPIQQRGEPLMFFFPSRWFRFLKNNQPIRQANRRNSDSRFRLHVEELESRLVPTSGQHYTLVDPGPQANFDGDAAAVQVANLDNSGSPNTVAGTTSAFRAFANASAQPRFRSRQVYAEGSQRRSRPSA